MSAAYLVEESDPRGVTRVKVGDSLVIGRTGDCGFVIHDAAASRRHMEIKERDGDYVWRDLDSTNGVYVNEEKRTEGLLHPGDRIRIGSTVLVFEVSDDDAQPMEPGSSTAVLRANFLEKLEHSHEAGPEAEADVLLEAVHAVMNDVASIYEPCSLVDRILETTMKAIHAQRGAIFFAGREDRLEPCPVCGTVHMIENGELKHAERDTIEISNTVARRVLKGGESVLIRDVERERQLDTAASVLALELRSIICVPLRGKYGILGILYIDSNRPGSGYTHAHMLLSTAVGNSAGLALENAQFHQEILAKQRMEQEIQFAANIQEGFLVHDWPSQESRYQVYAETRPAKIIGGDFYDFVKLNSGKVGVLVGDVSGKGVPAALTMAQVLAEFRMHAVRDKSPLEVIRALNRSQCRRSQRGMFVTLLYAVFDPRTGTCQCANAGHHPGLCVRRQGCVEFAAPSGPPIGVIKSAQWEESEIRLEPGDTIYLYTDGIVEARGAQTRQEKGAGPVEYGVSSLRVLAEDLRGEPPDVVVKEMLRDVQRFAEPAAPHDDCTLLALRYTG